MLEELEKNSELMTVYKRGLIARLTCSSIEMESKNLSDYTSKEAFNFSNLLEAFDYIFDKEQIEDTVSTLYHMGDIISKVTAMEFDSFRTTMVMVDGSSVERTPPAKIRMQLYYLYDNYVKIWSALEDPYLREAKFHIDFLRIHPFQDGNGRTARLLTVYNFWSQGIAPPVLPISRKKEYCQFIENADYEGMAKMMKELSKKEEVVISEFLNGYVNKKTRN